MSEAKPFCISRWEVWEGYKRVKANQGAAGVDEQTIADFERDRKGNLYKIWNRMSSGSYFPPPVRTVKIPARSRELVKSFVIALVSWPLASPILFLRFMHRAFQRWQFWRMAYTSPIVCRGCRSPIWLVGIWRCGCGYTYRGHLLRACPVCRSLRRIVPCFASGVTKKLPQP